MLVCGRPGDRGGGTETHAASVPRHKVQARHAVGTPGILKYVILVAEGNRIVKYCVVVLNYLFGVSKIVNFVKMTLFAKKPGSAKVTCFSGTDNEFPQES